MQCLNPEESMSMASIKQIASERADLVSKYPEIWSSMIEEWTVSGEGDLAWLMYSSNYLLHTGGVRWAIDPMTLRNRVFEAPIVNVEKDLQGLSVVLLTHQHKDHLDLDLLRRLRESCVHWIIPRDMLELVLSEALLQRDRVIVPMPYEPIDVCGLRITPFPGSHWDSSSFPNSINKPVRGVPSTGYLVEMAQKRWLFPGDTRTYDSNVVSGFGPVDIIFAHLWLGRGCALMTNPPLLDDFSRFLIAIKPSKIVLTHLKEHGRSAEEYWTDRHAEMVAKDLHELAPWIDVQVPQLGEAIRI